MLKTTHRERRDDDAAEKGELRKDDVAIREHPAFTNGEITGGFGVVFCGTPGAYLRLLTTRDATKPTGEAP
jgi:hypothetical protein